MTSSFAKIIMAAWLLMVLFLPEGLVYSWLKMKQKEIRREVKRKMHSELEKGDLIKLSFHKHLEKSNISWIKKGEFSYKNSLFDVVYVETTADSVIYFCWEDHEESKIKRELQKLSARAWGKHPERRDGHKKVIDFYKQLYFEDSHMLVFINYPTPTSLEIIAQHNNTLPSVFIPTKNPPPENSILFT